MRKVWLVLAVTAAACGSKASASGTGGGDAVSLDSTALDVPGDVTADAALPADASGATDAGPHAAGPFGEFLDKIDTAIQTTQTACCGLGHPCAACTEIHAVKWVESLADAANGNQATLDPGRRDACMKALYAAMDACDRDAAVRAGQQCLYAWVDKAAIGEDCASGAPLACAAGKGRCSLVLPPDGYACKTAAAKGDSCSPAQPCLVDLQCLNGTLTRDMHCSTPGASCNLSDGCWPGYACKQGSCELDTGGKGKGEACSQDGDCAHPLACLDKKCAPALCKP